MADPLLSSDEYDERAHRLYDDGEYESALLTLREGLRYYPHSVDLYVGLGYTQLAREEYIWAKQAFERGLVLDPRHEDALAGLGESLLWFGRTAEALELFKRARDNGGDDLELLMSIGRALYREKLYDRAHQVFEDATAMHADSAEAAAALGYTLHRLGDESASRRQLRRALHLDPRHHEARVYLGHMLYDRGDWAGALREYERVPGPDHWDFLAVRRTVELRRALFGAAENAPELEVWQARLVELTAEVDDVDLLLAELSGGEAEAAREHRIRLPTGDAVSGTWYEIVKQLRDTGGMTSESVAEFMRRRSEEERPRGLELPVEEPRAFVRGGERGGLWRIEY
ncbi:MAG: tetratricopeptide repeat protein [Longimicrobiales bacterium]